jgi:hypothetical protein
MLALFNLMMRPKKPQASHDRVGGDQPVMQTPTPVEEISFSSASSERGLFPMPNNDNKEHSVHLFGDYLKFFILS